MQLRCVNWKYDITNTETVHLLRKEIVIYFKYISFTTAAIAIRIEVFHTSKCAREFFLPFPKCKKSFLSDSMDIVNLNTINSLFISWALSHGHFRSLLILGLHQAPLCKAHFLIGMSVTSSIKRNTGLVWKVLSNVLSKTSGGPIHHTLSYYVHISITYITIHVTPARNRKLIHS